MARVNVGPGIRKEVGGFLLKYWREIAVGFTAGQRIGREIGIGPFLHHVIILLPASAAAAAAMHIQRMKTSLLDDFRWLVQQGGIDRRAASTTNCPHPPLSFSCPENFSGELMTHLRGFFGA